MASKSGFPGVQVLLNNGAANILNETSRQMAVKSGKVTFLSLEQLQESPHESKIYTVRVTDDIKALARDIARRGVQDALRVIPIDAETYEIVSGHRRFAAITYAVNELGYEGGEEIPCIISARPYKGREFETTENIILDNLQREKSDFERMMEIVEFKKCTELRKEAGEPIPNVRERIELCLGVSNSEITRFVKIYTSLNERLMDAFREQAIAGTVAYQVANLDDECQEYIAESWNREENPVLTLALVNVATAQFLAPATQALIQEENADKKQNPAKTSMPVVKSIGEGMEMLEGAYKGIFRSLNANVRISKKAENKILKKISRHMSQLVALQNELALMGLRPDDDEEE